MGTGVGSPPEGAAEWRPDFNDEERAQVATLREKMEAQARASTQLREAMGLSLDEFLQWLREDEFTGLPSGVPRPMLTLTKLQTFVTERGGQLNLTITLNGKTTSIPW